MDSTIKNLTITGSAASMNPETPKSRRGVSRRKVPKNKDAESYDPSQDLEPNNEYEKPESDIPPMIKPIITKVNLQPIVPQNPVIQQKPARPIQQPVRPIEPVQPQTTFVSNPVEKPKEITSVTLNPPKQPRVKLIPKVSGVKVPIQNQTRKVRKIQLPNLTNRITRAKRVTDETKKVPIDKIKAYLINKGVIQAKSKAPDSMLRSMYGDFNILKDGHAL